MDRDFLNVRALGQFYDILVIPLLTYWTKKPAVFYFSDVVVFVRLLPFCNSPSINGLHDMAT